MCNNDRFQTTKNKNCDFADGIDSFWWWGIKKL